ncbi:CAP domain-containing protein [Streptomyces albipurpureus]|uniref:CAP domain-containing protein n=1 Tax=Streptomyces albipurpureus TaxID=2897419 RepID=A0ABT0UFR2_9ACTN|nr:CAP domain-containing protein [Streptomyces sp. CWNU-1]MCM2387457.1 CAP domain-containing protein [Streptomyces sp. CWNU-1]
MAESYIVVGPYLRITPGDPLLRQTVTINANGSSIGPKCVATMGGVDGVYGSASGRITDRAIEFTITWDHGLGKAVHTGTVGPDGVPRGTATGAVIPNTWNPGPWQASAGALAGPADMSVEATELFRLINDARAHPNRYPPNGDATLAKMTACPHVFQPSKWLNGTAQAHNSFLASQPIDWVNTYPNMHKNPDGALVGDAGEAIDMAGYHSSRAEIVATGFPTAADAVRFWMQDDAPFQWGHRNRILDCGLAQAGVAHLQGGPGSHYWTVDMGTP